MQPKRLTSSPWQLICDALGNTSQIRGKLRRFFRVMLHYHDSSEVHQRLRRLAEKRIINDIPTSLQRLVGSVLMFHHFIIPAARDYYDEKDLSFPFHTLLRILDDPAGMVDPTGLRSERDTIIGHVMQVVHANPAYDLELLCGHEDGLEELERQLEAVISGTHPRTSSIQSTVEDPTYHPRLLQYVRDFRQNGLSAAPLLRENVEGNERFQEAARIFGSLRTTMAYFSTLPTTFPKALARLWRRQL